MIEIRPSTSTRPSRLATACALVAALASPLRADPPLAVETPGPDLDGALELSPGNANATAQLKELGAE